MPNMAARAVDQVLIVLYGRAPPTDAEWTEYLVMVSRHGIASSRHLVITEGGSPTLAQRRQLTELLAGRPVPVAVLSARARVRGAVTLLSWFNRWIKFFPPEAIVDALLYLEIPLGRADLLESALVELRDEMEVSRKVA